MFAGQQPLSPACPLWVISGHWSAFTRCPLYRDNSKAPTAASTNPLGNTGMKPSVLERGIGENVAAKLKDFPDQRRKINELVARKKAGGDGHSR
jgi:hypothetical protein